jgi:hypothetical protein
LAHLRSLTPRWCGESEKRGGAQSEAEQERSKLSQDQSSMCREDA